MRHILKLTRLLLVIGFLITLSGCIPKNEIISSVRPDESVIDSYSLGKEYEVSVGEVMLFRKDGRIYTVFKTTVGFQPPPYLAAQFPFVPAGTACIAIGRRMNGDIVCDPHLQTNKGSFAQSDYCLLVTTENNIYGDTACPRGAPVTYMRAPLAPFGKDIIIPANEIYPRQWEIPQKDVLKNTKMTMEGTFKQELIYNGKQKDTLRLTYREFKDDFARAAFTQDLTYDLTESKTIGFKKMKIDVIEATNSYIKFKVIESGM